MKNRLGINGATLPSSNLMTGLRVAASAGFSYYEPRIPQLLEFDHPDGRGEVAAVLARGDLQWLPINALENLFARSIDQLILETHRLCELAAGFGIDSWIAVPGAAEQGLSMANGVEMLQRIRRVAHSHGIDVFYEFIGFPRHAFSTLPQALEIAERAGVKLVLDTFHLAVSETMPETLRKVPAEAIGLVHLSDALVGERAVGAIDDPDRVLSGEGELPLPLTLQALAEIGFTGPISVEVFHPKYGQIDPERVAATALESARAALSAAGLPINRSRKNERRVL